MSQKVDAYNDKSLISIHIMSLSFSSSFLTFQCLFFMLHFIYLLSILISELNSSHQYLHRMSLRFAVALFFLSPEKLLIEKLLSWEKMTWRLSLDMQLNSLPSCRYYLCQGRLRDQLHIHLCGAKLQAIIKIEYKIDCW